ncbi:sulfotransferase 2A1-like isoform X5 [Notamacropus eugenii]
MENPQKFKAVKGIPFIHEIYDVEAIERMWNEFEFRDQDVIIVTYPKSGTHWMIDILSLIDSKGDPSWVKSVPYWKRSPWIEFKNQSEIIKNQSDPRILTSHLPILLFPKSYFTSKSKMIYVARNPKDVITSLYHFNNQLPFYSKPSTFEQLFVDFLQGHLNYGSWFDHIKGWLSWRDSEKFLLVTYEELHQVLNSALGIQRKIEDTPCPKRARRLNVYTTYLCMDVHASVKKICQFLDKKLSEEEISSVAQNASFQVMKKRIIGEKEGRPLENIEILNTIIMRKGICGDWKNHFTVTQMETFNKVYQEKMNGLDQDLFPWYQC